MRLGEGICVLVGVCTTGRKVSNNISEEGGLVVVAYSSGPAVCHQQRWQSRTDGGPRRLVAIFVGKSPCQVKSSMSPSPAGKCLGHEG